jgi:hypothetical protein
MASFPGGFQIEFYVNSFFISYHVRYIFLCLYILIVTCGGEKTVGLLKAKYCSKSVHKNSLKGVPSCVAQWSLLVVLAGRKENVFRFPRGHVKSLFSKTYSLALGATKDFIRWVVLP